MAITSIDLGRSNKPEQNQEQSNNNQIKTEKEEHSIKTGEKKKIPKLNLQKALEA